MSEGKRDVLPAAAYENFLGGSNNNLPTAGSRPRPIVERNSNRAGPPSKSSLSAMQIRKSQKLTTAVRRDPMQATGLDDYVTASAIAYKNNKIPTM